jgi:hypothetical protein
LDFLKETADNVDFTDGTNELKQKETKESGFLPELFVFFSG